MMHFSLQVNGQDITKVSVVNMGESGGEDEPGWFEYDWTAWRPDPEVENRIHRYATGRLVHRPDDGIEELAVKALMEYQRLLQAREDVLA